MIASTEEIIHLITIGISRKSFFFYFTGPIYSSVTSVFLVIYPQKGQNQRVEQHLFLGRIKNLVVLYRDEEYLVCEDGIKMSAALSYSFLSVLN